MNKKISKIIVSCVLIVAVAGGGYFGYKKYTGSKTVTSSKVITAKVKRANLDISVQATGTVTSVNQVDVYSQITGTIESLSVKEGDTIKKGDLICKINYSNGAQDITTAQNTLAQKQLALSQLQKNLDDLYIKAPIDGVIKSVYASSGDDVTTLKQAYGGLAIIVVNDTLEVPIAFPQSGKVASVYISEGSAVKKGENLFKLDDSTIQNNIQAKELEIQQAQSDLSFKQSNLSKDTVTSPIDGVISTLSFKEGNSIGQDKAIAAIVDPKQLQIIVPIDELDIGKVKVGQNANIGIDAVKGKIYSGTVQKISQIGKTTNNVSTYDVTVSVSNPEDLKPGMNANVTIAVESKENVLTVPSEALIQRNGKQYVMIPSAGGAGKTENKTSNVGGNSSGNGQNSGQGSTNQYRNSSGSGSQGKLTEVTIGLQNETSVEIVSGVKEGDSLLITLPQTTNKSNSNTQGAFGQGQNGMTRGVTGGGGGKN
jgi:RND family efflux transporter, MFP subunit